MDQLFARETGTGDEMVALLHGFTGSHQVWAEVQDRLAARARVIAYDLPGHAASLGWPGAGPVKAAVRAVLEDLSRRGIERVHLAGHSMGGAVSTLVALAEPGRVASLSLFAPGGFGPEINRRLLVNLAAARSEAELRDALDAMCGFETGVSDASVRAAVEMRAIPGQVAKLAEIAGILAGSGRQGAIPRDALASLTMPVVVAWGTLDPVLPFHQTNDLPPLFALHRLPGIGHMLIEEAPDLVTELIRRQLR